MAETPAPSRPDESGTPNTLRAIFNWRGDEVVFAGSRSVRMIAPAPTAPPPEGERTGYWFELHDASGRTIFHRALHDPIRADVEVFADDRSESIVRVASTAAQGEFELLVPDLPAARTFTLFGPPTGEQLRGTASKPLLRIALEELRRERPDADREPPKPDPGPR